MTPNGQADTQEAQPLHTSGCTITVPNSVRTSAPVGHTSRHAAWVQCLHTSEAISQRVAGATLPGSVSPARAGPSTSAGPTRKPGPPGRPGPAARPGPSAGLSASAGANPSAVMV